MVSPGEFPTLIKGLTNPPTADSILSDKVQAGAFTLRLGRGWSQK